MKKQSKIKINVAIGGFIGIIIILFSLSYIHFRNLNVYTEQQNGDIVSKEGIVYQFNGKLTSAYSSGILSNEKVIGRFKGENYFTTFIYSNKVIKLINFNEKDTFLVKGLMKEEVYTRKDKIPQENKQ